MQEKTLNPIFLAFQRIGSSRMKDSGWTPHAKRGARLACVKPASKYPRADPNVSSSHFNEAILRMDFDGCPEKFLLKSSEKFFDGCPGIFGRYEVLPNHAERALAAQLRYLFNHP